MVTKILQVRFFFAIPLGFLLSFAAHAIDLGFFDAGTPGKVYLHTPRRLNSDDPVTIFLKGNNSVLLLQGKDFYIDGESEQVSSDEDGRKVLKFKLKSGKIKADFEPQLVAAVIGTIEVKKKTSSEVKFTSKLVPHTVYSCYGIEGKNVYLSRDSKSVQHLYYYFNYDVEPTCKGD